MTQTIESYPHLQNAYVTMTACNGGLNRDRPLEAVLRASDPVIGAEGVYDADLRRMDVWIGMLTEDELLVLVDGEETETAALLAQCPVGEKLDGLLSDLFEA